MADTIDSFKSFIESINVNAQGGKDQFGANIGGRVGATLPISDNASLDVGLSGHAYKYGKESDIKATGIDAAINWGDSRIEAKYNQYSPEEKSLFINFIKSF